MTRSDSWALALTCALLACCGTETGSGHENPMANQALCTGLPDIDGRFTGWPDCREYTASHPGVFGDLNVRMGPEYIYILNDWHHRADEDIPAYYFNQFYIDTASDRWEVRVYGNDTVTVLRNGQAWTGIEGASGFFGSPDHPFPHTIYEFRIPLVGHDSGCTGQVRPGFAVTESDPGPQIVPPTPDEPEAVMQDEPTIFCVFADPQSGEPTITGVSTGPVITRAATSDGTLVLTGVRFGDQTGSVTANGDAIGVGSWSDRAIVTSLPPGGGTVVLRVSTPDGTSPPFALGSAAPLPAPDASDASSGDAEDPFTPDIDQTDVSQCPPAAPRWEGQCCTCAPLSSCSAGIDNQLALGGFLLNGSYDEAVTGGTLNLLALVREGDVLLLPAVEAEGGYAASQVGFGESCEPRYVMPLTSALPALGAGPGTAPFTWPDGTGWSTARLARLTLSDPGPSGLLTGAVNLQDLQQTAPDDGFKTWVELLSPDLDADGDGTEESVSFGATIGLTPAVLVGMADGASCALPAEQGVVYRVSAFQVNASGEPGDGLDVDQVCD